MSKSETSLPGNFEFNREVALLATRSLSMVKPQAQPQLLTFYTFTDTLDSELLCAVASKLDPNREDCRLALLDMATHATFSNEVASAAFDQLYMIKSWKVRKTAYAVIAEVRELNDLIWNVADGYDYYSNNLIDLEEHRE